MEIDYSGKLAPFPRERFGTFLDQLKVASKDAGLVPFRLLGSQRYMIEEIARGLDDGVSVFYCLKSRQVGSTTLCLAIDMFWAFEHKGLLGTFILHKEEARDDWRQTIDVFYHEIPQKADIGGELVKFRPSLERHNRNILSFKNGSRFRYLVAGTSENRRGGLGRSGSTNYLHATECAFYGDEEGLRAFRSSTSSIYPYRLQIFESTANGFNWFEEAYTAGKTSPGVRVIFVGWWRDERNVFATDHPLYEAYAPDRKLTRWERQRVNAVKREYDVDITMGQIAWYRWKLAEDFNNDESTALQELPWCVVAGTRVGTLRGIIAIEEVCGGDNATHGEVMRCGATGTADVFMATTHLGYCLTGTANHPLALEHGGFCELHDSETRSVRLCVPLTAAEPYVLRWREGVIDCAITITADVARLVGIFMGDGSMQRGAISIACDGKDEDVIVEVERLIKDLFGLEAQRRVGNGCTEVRLSSMLVYETFKAMGLLRHDTGPTMRRVHVPEFIWRSPLPVMKEFLCGLFEADGFNGYGAPRVVLFSMYPDFLADVQLLLLAFGITCRRTSRPAKTKGGDGTPYYYTAHELHLRSEEAVAFNERIGFIGKRKRNRHDDRPERKVQYSHPFPMKLCDEVVSVESKGSAQVFNLTIEPDHVFDANGILTHNTDEDAFQATGSKYFTSESLTDAIKAAKQTAFLSYRYRLGMRFEETVVVAEPRQHVAELRVWEQSSKYGHYVIGCDPAYGSSDRADRTVISVWRGYMDCLVQVAEFATPQVSTYQCAWVLAHLAGFYGQLDCRVNLEITGPGTAVWQELQQLKLRLNELKAGSETAELRNVFKHMRDYLYRKADSLDGGLAYHWKMTDDLKRRVMAQLKDAIELRRMIPRSVHLLEECRHIVNDEGHIEAEGGYKDDRVIAAALAHEAWRMWSLPVLRSQKLTLERSRQMEATGGDKPLDIHIRDYLKAQKISEGAPARLVQPYERGRM